MRRKILPALVLAALCAVILAPGAGAEAVDGGECGDNLTWTLYEDGLLEISGTGDMWDYRDTADDDGTGPVVPWLDYTYRIRSLAMEEGVTHIGSYSFFGLYNLTGDLELPEGVLSIGKCAFSECRALNGALILPSSLKTIGHSSFSCCVGLSGELILPDSITQIGDYAFIACGSLEKLVLPSGVQFIGERAFMDCEGLTGDLLIP